MTVSSMTGFARREGALGAWTWAVEARSVNGRNLEVRFKGPNGFEGLDKVARESAQARFQRGQLNVGLQARKVSDSRRERLNLEVLERYLNFGQAVLAAGRVALPSLDGLLALPGVVEVLEQEDDADERAMVEAAMAASIVAGLDGLRISRGVEGDAIHHLLFGFLDQIETLTSAAAAEASQQPTLIKVRFERRMTELIGDAVSAERIAQEAAVMAVKADVREEIDRLISHVAAARSLLALDGASGRRLDFLTQEFMREANTLCSKSASATLTAIGLDLKATIDQFREQVQNVE